MPTFLDLFDPREDTRGGWAPAVVVLAWACMGITLWFLGFPREQTIREGALAFWGIMGGLALPWLRKIMEP